MACPHHAHAGDFIPWVRVSNYSNVYHLLDIIIMTGILD
jgi:hypothetical protein